MLLPVQSLVVHSAASFISLPDTTLLAQSLFPKGLSLVLVSLKHGGKITEDTYLQIAIPRPTSYTLNQNLK